MIGKKVIVRGDRSGVFFGTLAERSGREVKLTGCRRLWYWDGAASLSQLAVDGTGHPRLGHHHRSTRGSKGSPTSPSTASPVPCSAFPHRAAVSGLAGVMSPVGLTHFDHGRTPPESLTGGPSPVAN